MDLIENKKHFESQFLALYFHRWATTYRCVGHYYDHRNYFYHLYGRFGHPKDSNS